MATMVVGQSRSGKTTGVAGRLLREVGKTAIVVLDPQRSLAHGVLKHSLSKQQFVLYDQLTALDRTLGWLNIGHSTNPNALQRMQEDNDELMEVARFMLTWKGAEPHTMPLVWEFLQKGLQLIQHSGAPLYWLPHSYRGTAESLHMIQNCQNNAVRDWWMRHKGLSPTQQRKDASPALRVAESICEDPAFIARCGNFDLEAALQNKQTILVEGFGANRSTIRIVFLTIIQRVIQFSETHDTPVILVIEEAGNFELITPDFLIALASIQKHGFEPICIFQNLGYDYDEQILQNCQRIESYACGSETAKRIAPVMSTPQLDDSKEHYRERFSRQRHNGYEDIDGRPMSIHQDYEEERVHYKSYQMQEQDMQKDLMTLPVGTRWVNENGKVWREPVPMIREPYPWPQLVQKKVEEAIHKIRHTRPEYQTPTLIGVNEIKGSSTTSQSTLPPSDNSSDSDSSAVTQLLREGL